MPYVYFCPVDGCEFTMQDSAIEFVVENAQEHQHDTHNAEPDRDEVEESITGTGTP